MGQTLFAIAAGASIGAILRWLLGLGLNALFPALPLGTLAANWIGGYAIGIALPLLLAHPEWGPGWRLFIVTGLLGGLTTFSAFSADIATLVAQQRWTLAAGGIALHVGGSLLLTLAGIATAATWVGRGAG